MMKAKTNVHKQNTTTMPKIQQIDGPPLDFSFKNIRLLTELLTINPSQAKISSQQTSKTHDFAGNQNSEKDINESMGEAKLTIIRTIDVDENKNEMVKQSVSKKTEKVADKVVKKVQVKTSTLFLRYNKLTSIEGFYEIVQQIVPHNKWQQLAWIDLSHNRLTAVGKELQHFTNLKNLYLHANFINNFKEIENLQELKLMRTFTIHGNPIQNYPEFRVLISCILPQVQKIDSALLTKREKERGQVLQKPGMKYPIIANPQKPPEQSEQQQQN